MDNQLFRKSSLERISSPEQLNEYIRATSPMLWVVLAGLLVLVLAAGIWSVTATLPETVTLEGSSHGNQIFMDVPLAVAKRLEPGLAAQVSPDYAPRETYGFIKGHVLSIGSAAVDGLVPIVIELQLADGRPVWSTLQGQQVELSDGSTCKVLVVTHERKPYELLF